MTCNRLVLPMLLPPLPVPPTVVRAEEPLCPICKIGHMHFIPPPETPRSANTFVRRPATLDSSKPMQGLSQPVGPDALLYGTQAKCV